jgi:flavorubredoxin
MPQAFKAIRITDRVHWVGAIDWTLRDFHGFETNRGSTYNAYLIVGDKITLVDTVKPAFHDEMLARIASVIDPGRIDYIVSNHAELDHSGSLPAVAALVKPEKLIATKAGVANLSEHFDLDIPTEIVKSGTTMELGDTKLAFHETRMMHWPESMFTWLGGDDVLFSQDVFGMHLASYERYTDQLPAQIVQRENAKYFANILLPYASAVGKVLGKMRGQLEKAKVIAPDHGPVWRSGVGDLLDQYQTWADRRPSRKVVVVYATMWESTAVMARAIGEGAAEAGVQVELLRLGQAHRSDVATELLDAAAIVVGSPNLNGQMFPTMADMLSYLRSLSPKNLIGAVFGSYGWNSRYAESIQKALEDSKVEIVRDPLLVKFVPRGDDLVACRALGTEIAAKIDAAWG